MRSSDRACVDNLRREYGNAIAKYSDETVAKAWRNFSLSDEYQDRHTNKELFPDWCLLEELQP